MSDKLKFPSKTIENAEAGASEILSNAQKQYGFVPNLYAGMANTPMLLDAYIHTYTTFRKESTFTPVEQEVIFLAVSRENECHYCTAAHSMVGKMMSKVPDDVLEALRSGGEIADEKLAALSKFTKSMVINRGKVSEAEVDAFLGAGYQKEQVLEVITAIGIKTFSNYFNHINETVVDEAFAAFQLSEV